MTQLLMIDDDVDLNALLQEYLGQFGFNLETAATAGEGLRRFKETSPDLIILDLMLPDKDGLTLCKEIRAEYNVPIIMLTARGGVTDRIVGLELGADDYMAKPFEPRELVARIETVLRRTAGPQPGNALQAGELTLHPETRRVILADKELELTSMEFELLKALMESSGRVLTRDQLLQKLRGFDAEVYDRSVDMHISRLRQKLGEDPRAPRFIKTIWRTGYQFTGK